MEIVRIENLSFTYPESKNKTLIDIDLTVNSGEFILLCGESGCGKTTLLKMLKKQLIPKGKTSGNIFLSQEKELTLSRLFSFPRHLFFVSD